MMKGDKGEDPFDSKIWAGIALTNVLNLQSSRVLYWASMTMSVCSSIALSVYL